MFRQMLSDEFRHYAELSVDQLDRLEEHYKLLLRWNQRLNLIRFKDLIELVRLHYCESLFLALKLPEGPLRIADVGSGAGFPGIPIAVLRPGSNVSLIERDQRKAVFLRDSSRQIPNTRVLALGAEVCNERFDWVVARAVPPKEVLALGLAPSAALLISDKDAPAEADVVKVPWGEHRVLSVSRGTVPRETPL